MWKRGSYNHWSVVEYSPRLVEHHSLLSFHHVLNVTASHNSQSKKESRQEAGITWKITVPAKWAILKPANVKNSIFWHHISNITKVLYFIYSWCFYYIEPDMQMSSSQTKPHTNKAGLFNPWFDLSGLLTSCPQAEDIVQAEGSRETYGWIMLTLWPICGYYKQQNMTPAFFDFLSFYSLYILQSHTATLWGRKGFN